MEKWAVRLGDLWCVGAAATANGSLLVSWDHDRVKRLLFTSVSEAEAVRKVGGRTAVLAHIVATPKPPPTLRALQTDLVMAKERIAALETCLQEAKVAAAMSRDTGLELERLLAENRTLKLDLAAHREAAAKRLA